MGGGGEAIGGGGGCSIACSSDTCAFETSAKLPWRQGS